VAELARADIGLRDIFSEARMLKLVCDRAERIRQPVLARLAADRFDSFIVRRRFGLQMLGDKNAVAARDRRREKAAAPGVGAEIFGYVLIGEDAGDRRELRGRDRLKELFELGRAPAVAVAGAAGVRRNLVAQLLANFCWRFFLFLGRFRLDVPLDAFAEMLRRS